MNSVLAQSRFAATFPRLRGVIRSVGVLFDLHRLVRSEQRFKEVKAHVATGSFAERMEKMIEIMRANPSDASYIRELVGDGDYLIRHAAINALGHVLADGIRTSLSRRKIITILKYEIKHGAETGESVTVDNCGYFLAKYYAKGNRWDDVRGILDPGSPAYYGAARALTELKKDGVDVSPISAHILI